MGSEQHFSPSELLSREDEPGKDRLGADATSEKHMAPGTRPSIPPNIIPNCRLVHELVPLQAAQRGSQTLLMEWQPPSRASCTSPNRRISYAAFAEKWQAARVNLTQHGVEAGCLVCILSEPSVNFMAAAIAAMSLGAVPVLLGPHLPASTLADMAAGACDKWQELGQLAPTGAEPLPGLFLMHSEQLTEKAAAVAEAWQRRHATVARLTRAGIAPAVLETPQSSGSELTRPPLPSTPQDYPAVFLFTSGTTGRTPRSVPLTHADILSGCYRGLCSKWDLHGSPLTTPATSPPVVTQAFLPLHHPFGFNVSFVSTLFTGSTLAFTPGGSFLPEHVVQACRELRPDCVMSVPWVLNYLAEKGGELVAPLRHCKAVWYGGAPLLPKCGVALQEAGVPLVPDYGQTETGTSVLFGKLGSPYSWQALYPGSGVQCKLGEEGELILLSSQRLQIGSGWPGLVDRPESAEDRWRATGDCFAQLPDGGLVYSHRLDDLQVHSTGKKSNPLPLEAALVTESGGLVQRACVIGEGLPFSVAVLELNASALESSSPTERLTGEQEVQLKAAVQRANVAAVQSLESVIVWEHVICIGPGDDPLPLTAKMTVVRRAVIARFKPELDKLLAGRRRAALGRSVSTASGYVDREKCLSLVCTHVGTLLGWERPEGATWLDVIPLEQSFVTLGLSSALVVKLCSGLAAKLQIAIPPTLVFEYPSARALADAIFERCRLHEPLLRVSDEDKTASSAGDTVEMSTESRGQAFADALLARLENQPPSREEPPRVAIVGVGCRLPGGASNPNLLWANLQAGKDCVVPVPPNRWDNSQSYDPDSQKRGKTYLQEAAFLSDDISAFDADFFGLSLEEARGMDPQQRLLLEVTWEALEDAGILPAELAGRRGGVFMGVLHQEYGGLLFRHGRDVFGIDKHFGGGATFSALSGKLSALFGCQGPSITLETACSSALVAVHLARESLLRGETDVCLAGGVNLILGAGNNCFLSRARMISPTNRCHTFDVAADGFARGEGCGVLVLKRLADAEAAGDCILGVLRGSAVNHSGRSNGLSAPSVTGQVEAIRAALASADVSPDDVSYVETHGTGTILGDAVELEALRQVFTGRPAERALVLGALKTSIGHTESVAGVASLIKVLACLKHERIPRNLHLTQVSPSLPTLDSFQACFPRPEGQPWPSEEGRPRIASISAFGFAGTNAHVILEEYRPTPLQPSELKTAPCIEEPELLLLSAHSRHALSELTAKYAAFLEAKPEEATASLGDVCFTAATGRARLRERVAFLTDSTSDLAAQLRQFSVEGALGDSSCIVTGAAMRQPEVVLHFSDCCDPARWRAPETIAWLLKRQAFAAAWSHCEAAFTPLLRKDWQDVVNSDQCRSETEGWLHDLALQYSLAQLLASWGVRPLTAAGQGRVGSFAAACFAGVLTLEVAAHLLVRGGGSGGAQGLSTGPATCHLLLLKHNHLVSKGELCPLELLESASTQQAGPCEALNRGLAASQTALVLTLGQSIPTACERIEGVSPLKLVAAGNASPSQLLRALGQLFVAGVGMDWHAYFAEYSPPPKKVSLPTYAFQRERFWHPRVVHSAPPDPFARADTALTTPRFAFLGRPVPQPLKPDVSIFQSVVGLKRATFLAGYAILVPSKTPELRFPLGGYLELAMECAAVLGRPLQLSALTVKAPLRVSDNEDVSRILQLVLSPSPTGLRAEFFSHGSVQEGVSTDVSLEGSCQWTLHADGMLDIGAAELQEDARPVEQETKARIEGDIPGLSPQAAEAVVGGSCQPLEDFIVSRVAAVLNVPEGDVDPQESFTEQGLDSLMVSVLRGHLGAGLGVPLPLPTLLEHPSAATLAVALQDQVAAKLRQQAHSQAARVTNTRARSGSQSADVSKRWKRCAERSFGGKEVYALLGELGVVYSGQFQGLQELRLGEGEALGRVALPHPLEAEVMDFVAHPALIDACLHVITAFFAYRSDTGAAQPHLAVAVEHFAVHTKGPELRSVGHKLLVHFQLEEDLTGDLHVYDAKTGALLAEFEGVKVERQEAFGSPYLLANGHVNGNLPEASSSRATVVELAGSAHNEKTKPPAGLPTWLHADDLRASKRDQAAPGKVQGSEVAIIGMACRLPGGSHSPAVFWTNLDNGKDAVVAIPTERWDNSQWFSAEKHKAGATYTQKAALLEDDVAAFDAPFFGMSAREAAALDPQQRLLLEATWEALENAAVVPTALEGSKTGVFMGAMNKDYENLFWSQGRGDFSVDEHHGGGQAFSGLAGRVSYFLKTRGPCIALDTACSSAVTAIHLGRESLLRGESDLCLAGGVSLILTPVANVLLSQAGVTSQTDCAKPFDTAADGYIRGEGCAVLVLKRLKEAEAAGDPILGVLASSVVNHAGWSAQGAAYGSSAADRVAFICQSLQEAGVKPDDVGLVETHAAGMVLPDSLELEALRQVFQGRSAQNPLFLGALRTNIGNTEAASGAAAVVKLLLCLQQRRIPRNLHFNMLHPAHPDPASFHAHFPLETVPWTSASGAPRVAMVSSFGLSGASGHVVLREYQPQTRPLNSAAATSSAGPHVFTLSAQTREALQELSPKYVRFLEGLPGSDSCVSLSNICFTAATGRAALKERLAIVSTSTSALASQLRQLSANGLESAAGSDTLLLGQAGGSPEVVFEFAGSVDLSPSELDWLLAKPAFFTAWEECRSAFALWGCSLDETKTGRSEAQWRLRAFSLEYSIAKLFSAWGGHPSAVVATGQGALAAACLAGVLSLEAAAQLLVSRAAKLPSSAAATCHLVVNSKVVSRGESCPLELLQSAAGGSTVEQLAKLPSTRKKRVVVCIGGQLERSSSPNHLCYNVAPLSREGQGEGSGVLQVVAGLFTAGVDVNWVAFYPPGAEPRPKKVMLPNYAFQRARHWPDLLLPSFPRDPFAVFDAVLTTPRFALLGRKVLQPLDSRKLIFQSVLSLQRVPFLAGHAVAGDLFAAREGASAAQVLFPMTGFLELAAECAVLLKRRVRVSSLLIHQALAIAGERGVGRVVQVVLGQEGDPIKEGLSVRFYSQGPVVEGKARSALEWAESQWVLHAEAAIEYRPSDKSNGPELPPLKGAEPPVPQTAPRDDPVDSEIEGLSKEAAEATLRGSLEPLEDYILSKVAVVLNVPESSLERTVTFTELGLDSLQVSVLRGHLGAGLGVPLPLPTLLEHPSATTLAAALRDQVVAKLQAHPADETCQAPVMPARHVSVGDSVGALWERYAKRSTPGRAVYAELHKRGLLYGGQFLGLQELRMGDAEALGRLVLPAPQSPEVLEFVAHPALLDTCLHVMASFFALRSASSDGAHLPVSVSGFQIFTRGSELRTVGHPLLVHYRLRTHVADYSKLPAALTGDLTIHDAKTEALLGELKGVTVMKRQAPKQAKARTRENSSLSNRQELEKMIYGVEWVDVAPLAAPRRQSQGLTLVVGDGAGLGTRLLQRLTSQGSRCQPLCSAELGSESFRRAVHVAFEAAGHALEAVIYVGCVQPADVAEPLVRTRNAYLQLLSLVQALASHGSILVGQAWPRLVVLSAGLRDGRSVSGLVGRAVSAMLTSIAAELDELTCTQLDLDLTYGPHNEWPTSLVDACCEEIGSGVRQVSLRLESGAVVRSLAQLQPRALPPVKGALVCREDAVYVVTGAFGGIGPYVVDWLTNAGAKHVAALSRRDPQSPAVVALSQKLEARGVALLPVKVDLAVSEDVTAAVSDVIKTSGLPIAGAVLLTGATADASVLKQTAEQFDQAWSSKAAAAWNLHQALPASLDFFVTFSSISSVLPSAGQCNYAAANGLVDALAHMRRAAGLPALSVNWGPWSEVGMAARRPGLLSAVERAGIVAFPPTLCVAALDALCSGGAEALGPQVTVLSAKWHRFLAPYLRGTGEVPFYFQRLLEAKPPVTGPASVWDVPLTSEDSVKGGRAAKSQPKRVVYLFTGQGAQRVNMGRALFEQEPAFRRVMEECDAVLAPPVLPQTLLSVLYPPAGDPAEEACCKEQLNSTRYAQPALFAVQCALFRALEAHTVEPPAALLGHSVGELAAATMAGVFSLSDGARLVAERARLMDALPPNGMMLAVAEAAPVVETAIRRLGVGSTVAVAAYNGPRSTVLAGLTEAVELVAASLGSIPQKRLAVSHAFHSPLMAPAARPFRQLLDWVPMASPRIPIASTVSGHWEAEGRTAGGLGGLAQPAHWESQLLLPVQFESAFKLVEQLGVDAFVEIGPGPVLTKLAQRYAMAEAEAARSPLWLVPIKAGKNECAAFVDTVKELAR